MLLEFCTSPSTRHDAWNWCIQGQILIYTPQSFSSPVAALLLVSTKNRDLWPCPSPCPTTEVRDSRTSRHSAHALSQVWQIWLVLVSIYCVYKSIQNRNVVGPGQRSRFLVLTKRSAASGDENAPQFDNKGYNVRLGTRRQIDDYVKYVTINRMCRNITVF